MCVKKLMLMALLIASVSACSGSAAFRGLPPSAIPEPTLISPSIQKQAAGAVEKMQAADRASLSVTLTPRENQALRILLEASAVDREALRILRRKASQ